MYYFLLNFFIWVWVIVLLINVVSELISAIDIFNVTGQQVLAFNNLNTTHYTINNIDLPKGIYFVKVSSSDLKSQNIKLIIE